MLQICCRVFEDIARLAVADQLGSTITTGIT